MDRPLLAPALSNAPRLTWRHAIALWLALLALTVQMFAPAAHARTLQRFADGPVNGYLVICAADGLKVISLDELSASDAGDGKAVGFHLPFDVQTKTGKLSCCLAAGVPALAPDVPDVLPPACAANATGPPRAQGPQLVDGGPSERPGHPRDPPLFHVTASS